MSATTATATAAMTAAAVILWGISVYNNLVKLSNMRDEAWGGVDVQLKRRSDLVPNLIATVNGYAAREDATLRLAAEARGAISGAVTAETRIEAENTLAETLRRIFALAETYPELKADTNFIELQREMSSLENDIQLAQRYYNSVVADFNIAVQSFPALLISRSLGYAEAKMFEDGDAETAS